MHEELLQIEHELGSSSADAYRQYLAEDAVVIVPGAVMDRDQCIEAIDATPPWDEHEISEARSVQVAPETALLTYRWRSRRGDMRYEALMSTVYVRRDGAWRVALHQQTPE